MQKEITQSITRMELIKYVNEHPEINYISYIVTPYTFLCARAVIRYLSIEKGLDTPNGIIEVMPWQPDKWAINTELSIDETYSDFYSMHWVKMNCELEEKLNKFCNLLRAIKIARKKNEVAKRKVYVIHIDGIQDSFAVYAKAYTDIEFIHFYLDEPREPYYNIFERIHVMRSRVEYLVPTIKRNFRKKILGKCLLKSTAININILHTFDKEYFFSRNYVLYMKMILEEEGKAYNFSPKEKYILYLSNAYDEVTHKLIMSIAETLLSKLAKQGYKIYVKQHPREKLPLEFKAFDAFYIPNNYAVESFIASVTNKPYMVIGAETTSLAKIALFWNIPCYCILDQPPLWNNKKYEWTRGYNDCAMRMIPNFKYSKQLF